jgi:hypothetical protein
MLDPERNLEAALLKFIPLNVRGPENRLLRMLSPLKRAPLLSPPKRAPPPLKARTPPPL